MENHDLEIEYSEIVKVFKEPMITYDSWIDRFVLDAPNGERYYFRDWDGAEDFFLLNFKEPVG